jgi:hypothetical protein
MIWEYIRDGSPFNLDVVPRHGITLLFYLIFVWTMFGVEAPRQIYWEKTRKKIKNTILKGLNINQQFRQVYSYIHVKNTHATNLSIKIRPENEMDDFSMINSFHAEFRKIQSPRRNLFNSLCRDQWVAQNPYTKVGRTYQIQQVEVWSLLLNLRKYYIPDKYNFFLVL